jgi:hypothetical protein
VISIEAGGKKYRGPYLWKDISLGQYIALAGVKIPEKYQQFVVTNSKFDSSKQETVDNYLAELEGFTDQELTVEFPAFYKKVIATLTDIPPYLLRKMSAEKATEIYDNFFRPFLLSQIYNTPVVSLFAKIKDYEPPFTRRIRLRGKYFYFPETVQIQEEDQPLAKEPILTFAEACDLFKNSGGFSRNEIPSLVFLLAIYCRPRGEEYSEEKMLSRIELFKTASMDATWSLFFYTCRRLHGSANFTRLFSSLPKTIKAQRNGITTISGTDL